MTTCTTSDARWATCAELSVDYDLRAREAAQTRQDALDLLAQVAYSQVLEPETRDLARAALRACGHVTLGDTRAMRQLARTMPGGHLPYVEPHHTVDDIARAGILAALTEGWYHATTLLAILRDKIDRTRLALAEVQIRTGRAYPHLVRAARGDAAKLEESLQRAARALAATLTQRETEHAARRQQ